MTKVYIDPGNIGTGIGTIDRPFNTAPAIVSDTEYLFKAGTVYSGSFNMGQLNNVTFSSYGEGERAKIMPNVPGGEVFRFNSQASNITISNLEITSVDSKANVVIHFRGYGENNTIKNCIIYGGTFLVRMRSLSAQPNDMNYNFTIDSNIIHDSFDDSIYLYKVIGVQMTNNIVYNVNMNWKPPTTSQKIAAGDGLQAILCSRLSIAYNNIDRSSTGNKFCIIISGTTTVDDNYMVFNNNTFLLPKTTSEGGAGIYISAGLHLNIDFNFNTLIGDRNSTTNGLTGLWYQASGEGLMSSGNKYIHCSRGISHLNPSLTKAYSYDDLFQGCGSAYSSSVNHLGSVII